MCHKLWQIVSILALAGLMLIGVVMCNSSNVTESLPVHGSSAFESFIQLPSVDDSVDLVSVASDTANTILTVSMSVYENQQFTGYVVKMRSIEPQDLCDGWEAMLLNSSMTDTLWTYQFDWDCEDMSWHRITERAGDDYLIITIEEDGDDYVETYIQDDDTLVLTYDMDLYDGIHGDTSKYDSAELSIIDSLEDAFAAFYDNSTDINDNDHGTLLTELIDSDDFWDWMYERMYNDSNHNHPVFLINETLDDYCDDHHYCPVKCGDEDNWSNSGCYECHLSYLICTVYDLFVQLLAT